VPYNATYWIKQHVEWTYIFCECALAKKTWGKHSTYEVTGTYIMEIVMKWHIFACNQVKRYIWIWKVFYNVSNNINLANEVSICSAQGTNILHVIYPKTSGCIDIPRRYYIIFIFRDWNSRQCVIDRDKTALLNVQ
jgi:hypothetical protein